MFKLILTIFFLLATAWTTVNAKSQEERIIWVFVTDSYGKPLAHISINTVEWGKPVLTTNSGKAGVPVSPTAQVGDPIHLIITNKHYATVTGGTIGIRISNFNRPDKPIPISLRRISVTSPPLANTRTRVNVANDIQDPFQKGKRAIRAQRFLEAFDELSKAYDTRRESYQVSPNKKTRKEYADVNRELGLVLVALNRVTEGMEKLKEAIRLDPTDDDSKLSLGIFGITTGNVQEAEEMFSRLMSSRPLRSEELKWTSYFFMARLYYAYGKFDESNRLQQTLSRQLSIRSFATNREIDQLIQVISGAEADALAEKRIPSYAYPSLNLALIILHKARLGLVVKLDGSYGSDIPAILEDLSRSIPAFKQAEKEKTLNRLLDTQRRLFGHDHLFVGLSLLQNAVFNISVNRLREAESSLSEAQSIFEKSLGKSNYWTGLTHAGLAHLQAAEGRIEDAKRHWRYAQEILCQPGDQMNLSICTAVLEDVSDYYKDQKNYSEAIPPLRRALDIQKSLWAGKDSEGTATILENIAKLKKLYNLTGGSLEIESLQREKQRIEELGVKPRKDIWSYEPSLAVRLNGSRCHYQAYFDFVKYPPAKPLLEAALRATKYISTTDPDVIETKYRLAAIYAFEDQYRQASDLVKQALAANESLLQPNREVSAALLNLQAIINEFQDNNDNAETGYLQAENESSVIMDDRRQDRAFYLFGLGRVQRKKQNYAEAEKNLRRALELRETADNKLCRELDSVTILVELANLYVDSGRYVDADKAFQQVLNAIGDCCLADYKDSPSILDDYARCLRKMDREADARNMEARALSLRDIK